MSHNWKGKYTKKNQVEKYFYGGIICVKIVPTIINEKWHEMSKKKWCIVVTLCVVYVLRTSFVLSLVWRLVSLLFLLMLYYYYIEITLSTVVQREDMHGG